VLDAKRGRILVFDRATATTSRSIGSLGSGPGQVLEPTSLAVDGAGTVTVADGGNFRIVRFGADGGFLGSFGVDSRPRGVAVTADGSRIYVSDTANRITVYAPDGTQLDQFGGTGSKLGKLNAPADVALDPGGNLWVADRGNNRVQEFGPNGERLLAFGTRGTADGDLLHPTGIAVDCNGKVTVSDTDNNRVQTYTLAAPAPGGLCNALPAPAPPPALKFPTLPAPLGPVVTLRALRTSGLLTARNLPVRVGCDTTCKLTASVTIAQRAKPAKGKKPVSISVSLREQTIPAGTSRVVRFAFSRTSALKLRKALKGRKGLDVAVQVTAVAAAGQPTDQATRIMATA
jgi:DNA-binding beta-propeller fold protein YncE